MLKKSFGVAPLALVTVAGIAGSAFAQCPGAPTIIEDLGVLAPGTTTRTPTIAAAGVAWYKFTLASPVSYSGLTFLNVDTLNSVVLDTEVAVYNCAGALVATDDDDALAARSALSFGTGDGTFAGPFTSFDTIVNNGRDGDMPAGDYYVAVSAFSTTHNATAFGVTSTSTNTGVVAVNLTLGATPSVAAPANTIDLGTLATGSALSNATGALSASNSVQWYKIVLPGGSVAAGTFVDMDTEQTALTPSNTTRMVLYTPAGAYLSLTDLTDGSNSLSQLSFGVTTPARPAVGNSLTYNGRDGALRAGTYYLGVAGTGTGPGTSSLNGANFGFASTSTNFGPVTVNFNTGGVSTSPSLTGTFASPSTTNNCGGQVVTLTTRVIGGANPASIGAAARVDLTAFGGSATQLMFDDGTNGDTTAGDGLFNVQFTVSATQPIATNTLTLTAFDTNTTRTSTGTVNVTVANPVNGVGTSFGCVTTAAGGTRTLRVAATGCPNSAPYSVVVDGTLLGLPSSIALADDGLNGDLLANDGTYGSVQTVAPGVVANAYSLPYTITDSQGRTRTGNTIPVTVTGTAAPAGTGVETIAGATIPLGTGALTSIADIFVANSIEMFRINICDPATFSATTVGGTTNDTQLFLFRADGTGVVFNDDTANSQSAIGGPLTAALAVGDYYLAVGVYNRDPIANECGELLWNNSPFTGQRAPDGPAASGTLFGWTNTVSTTGAYTIALTGACFPVIGPVCDSIDFNNDGLFPDTTDIDDFLSVFGGGPCSNDPNCGDIDFNNDGLFPDTADIDSLLSVFGGGPCL
jgi:hypothetical protein